MVGTLRSIPVMEQPVAVPLETVNERAPVPEPPVTTSPSAVLIGDAVDATTSGDVGSRRAVLETVKFRTDEVLD